MLKILSRRKDNRLQFGRPGIETVLQHLSSLANKQIAAEAANIILNVCYERDSVALVVQCSGIPSLVMCLHDSNADLQANAAGAIQSICFQVEQKRHAHRLVPNMLLLEALQQGVNQQQHSLTQCLTAYAVHHSGTRPACHQRSRCSCSPDQVAGLSTCESAQPCSGCLAQPVIRLYIYTKD